MNSYRVINACECSIRVKGKVCLVLRNELKKHYPNYYCFPGGNLNDSEDSLVAVKREVFEETGISLENEKLKLSVIEYNFHDDDKELWIIYTFKVELDSIPNIISSDEGEVCFVETDKARTLNLVPQTKSYFDHTQTKSQDILLITQHFIKDTITDVTNTVLI